MRGPLAKGLDGERANNGNVNVSGTLEAGRAEDQVHAGRGAGGIGQGENHFTVDMAPLVPAPSGEDLTGRVVTADKPPPIGTRPGMDALRVEQLAAELTIGLAVPARANTPRDGQVKPNAEGNGELGVQHVIAWRHRELSPCTGAYSPSTMNGGC